MADLVQTPANVVRVYGATFTGTAGTTITAGEPVYRNPSDGLLYPALNDTAVHADALGIALNGASVGQSVTVQINGQVNIGATLILGMVYQVSVNAGKIAPVADILPAAYGTFLGMGVTTAGVLQLKPLASGVAHG